MTRQTMTEAVPEANADSLSRDDVARVWSVTNRHFGLLLSHTDRSETKIRAETKIRSQVEHLREAMKSHAQRLKSVEAYVTELERQSGDAVSKEPPEWWKNANVFSGEWHFLYVENNELFGYMKLVPDSVTTRTDGSAAIKRAEFTIPKAVLEEAARVTIAGTASDCPGRSTVTTTTTRCPCCGTTFGSTEFWKHALFEIAQRGNTVPAWQPPECSSPRRWIVASESGWRSPIYRPRQLDHTCEMGQCLADLKVPHFASERDFSRALDNAFGFLALQLKT